MSSRAVVFGEHFRLESEDRDEFPLNLNYEPKIISEIIPWFLGRIFVCTGRNDRENLYGVLIWGVYDKLSAMLRHKS